MYEKIKILTILFGLNTQILVHSSVLYSISRLLPKWVHFFSPV